MKKRILAVILTLMLLVGMIAIPSTVGANGAPTTLMCFCLDSSGSIDSGEWAIMLNGLKAAVNDPTIMPRDGSLEICIVQFGSVASQVMAPTVVNNANVAGIIAAINAIVKDDGLTAMGAGILQCLTTMQLSTNFSNAAVWKVINMATDGEPNVFPTATPAWTGRTYAEFAVTTVTAAGKVQEIDVEGIGTNSSQNTWMATSIAYPDGTGPGVAPLVPPASYPPRPPAAGFMGFVRVCATFNDYADAVNQKITLILKGQLSLTPLSATNEIKTQHCVVATLLDGNGLPFPGATINFVVTGPNATSGSATTDTAGQAQFCYTGANVGIDTIVASCNDPADPTQILTSKQPATKTWNDTPGEPPIEVGGDIYPVSKVALLTPLFASAIILAGAAILVWRRRTQS